MSPHRTHPRTLAYIRRAWRDHLKAARGRLTEDNAEDFLRSAHGALATLADEIRAQLRLGVAQMVDVSWDEECSDWHSSVFMHDRPQKRCLLGEYYEMPRDVTEDDLRKAVVEVAFVHNVTLELHDVEVDMEERFASWGEGPAREDPTRDFEDE